MSIAASTQTLTERFAYAVELVLRGLSLSLPKSREAAPLALGTWNRLRRLVARFSALVAAVEAGRVSSARRTAGAERRPSPLSPENPVRAHMPAEAPARTGQAPPKAYGWLLTLAPELNTRIGRAQIETLLGDPAFLTLLAQAPQAGRILRPLCHMLRIALPECLKLPPRHRRPASAGDAKPARVARPPRPPKPGWLCWPKSPPLPGMQRRRGTRPRSGAGTGPPEA